MRRSEKANRAGAAFHRKLPLTSARVLQSGQDTDRSISRAICGVPSRGSDPVAVARERLTRRG